MRDPKRIEPMLNQLRTTWYANPNMRFGQLLVTATGVKDPFYVEDDKLREKLEAGIQSVDMPETDIERIERLIKALRAFWTKYPDWRLCQVAVNMCRDLENVDDEIMIMLLKSNT